MTHSEWDHMGLFGGSCGGNDLCLKISILVFISVIPLKKSEWTVTIFSSERKTQYYFPSRTTKSTAPPSEFEIVIWVPTNKFKSHAPSKFLQISPSDIK